MSIPQGSIEEALSRYETVIGLEVHCQLGTESKIFTPDYNTFGTEPNTNLGPITLALPGTLPKLNQKTIAYAVRLGLACGCSITRRTIFDRKNYFYPDLPKGYQLSQDKAPICQGGQIGVVYKNADGQVINGAVRLHHIHLEEDAGKSVHDGHDTRTLLDYNRAGTPLVEMVTEPDLRSAEEAGAFLTEVRRLVRYLDISDGNMEEGSLRCDLNVSVRLYGASEYGTKVEIKNMNSIRNVMRAVEFERRRQVGRLEQGESIALETRMFDPANGQTYSMRVKETMNDYRYFPDPDLCPVVIGEAWLDEIRAAMPALPEALRRKFQDDFGISAYDAYQLTDTREIATYFEALCSETPHYKTAANWMMGPVKSYLNEHGGSISDFPLAPKQLAALIELVASETISHTVASQQLFPALLEQPEQQPEALARANNWLLNRDSEAIEQTIQAVLDAMPDKVVAFRKGKKGLMGLFVGEVMKKTGGTADPKLITQLLTTKLNA
jgi:aspartyl-tRNA(Asn)/glutamyl-tRNA(Gln) amidotransferase subunit B